MFDKILSVFHSSFISVILIVALTSITDATQLSKAAYRLDPMTRYIHIEYSVPDDAPTEIVVVCSWSSPGKNNWQAAKVTPFLSETGLELVTQQQWNEWLTGKITERNAAGLTRIVVFNPYPQAQLQGRVDVDFRIQLQTPSGKTLTEYHLKIKADNSDVIYLEDWSKILQQHLLTTGKAESGKWQIRSGQNKQKVSLGNDLYGHSELQNPLPPLTYPLSLQGHYAIYVCTKPAYGIAMRLSSAERYDKLGSDRRFEEVLWQWPNLKRQFLILRQLHSPSGWSDAQLDYIKLVPLTSQLTQPLNEQFGNETDKMVAGYYEPYSWAFIEDVTETLQHREPLTGYKQARVQLVDMQQGRFGSQMVYETLLMDRQLQDAVGDLGERTNGVGKMMQYTNPLEAQIRYATELGLIAHANFGAGNCYLGTPSESDIIQKHPEWVRKTKTEFVQAVLGLEKSQVRQHAISLYRETLEIGAAGMSIDFCRYPDAAENAEAVNLLLRDMHALADEFSQKRADPVTILVRFPAHGVRQSQNYDYVNWVRQGWVDYLCPSNIQGRHFHFDLTPYLKAVEGSACKLLPCIDGLSWGPAMPGPFLWRIAQQYNAGADGVYVYQADARVQRTKPRSMRCMRILASSEAINRFWDDDQRNRSRHSKDIYLVPPHIYGKYYHWERLRFWVDGVPLGPVQCYLDGKLLHQSDGPPYLLGSEDYESDHIIPSGPHELLIKVRDGDGWLEKTFSIIGAGG